MEEGERGHPSEDSKVTSSRPHSPRPSDGVEEKKKRKKRGRGGGGKEKEKKTKRARREDVGQVDEEEYLVEKIIDKKYDEQDGVYKYFIKWIGWPSSTNTWEPLEHLNGCDQLLKDFELKWGKEQERKKLGASLPKESDKGIDLKGLGVLPERKVVDKMLGVVKLGEELTYIVAWGGKEGGKPDMGLVNAKVFAQAHPQIVIHFYQKRIRWVRDEKTEELANKLRAQLKAASTAAAAAVDPPPGVPTPGAPTPEAAHLPVAPPSSTHSIINNKNSTKRVLISSDDSE